MRKITCTVRPLTEEEKKNNDFLTLNSEAFISLIELIKSLTPEERAFWEKEREKLISDPQPLLPI